MKGRECYYRLNGGAVGVSDNAVIPLDILRVNFGNDKGNGGVGTPLTRIVDYRCATLGKKGSERFRSGCACAKKSDIYFRSAYIFFVKLDNGIFFA